jgi:hypothetical protein
MNDKSTADRKLFEALAQPRVRKCTNQCDEASQTHVVTCITMRSKVDGYEQMQDEGSKTLKHMSVAIHERSRH